MMWSEMIGRTLGAYEIVAELGRGGAARVYRARQRDTGQIVAIKVIPNDAEDPQLFVRRFEIETQIVRALDHPNIVAVYDAGETEELVYLVMQCVDGGNLRQRISQGPIEQTQAIAYAIQAARALHHAHQRGVVHRDVKPSNMLLDAEDPTHLLLADFGIAKIQGLRGITKSGTIVGTPEYMAPEQAENRESDPRSDIYSLGCVVYELLTGRPPFTAPYPLSVLHQHLHSAPAYIRGYNPSVPKQLCRVVEIALSKNPDARFPTAEHFARALAPFAEPGYQGASSEPLAQVTLPPLVGATLPPAAMGAAEHDLPTQPLPVERASVASRATHGAAQEDALRGPWPLVLGEQVPREPAMEETVRLGTAAPVPNTSDGGAQSQSVASGLVERQLSAATAPETGRPRPTIATDPLKTRSSRRPARTSAPVSHAPIAQTTAGPSPDTPRPRVTSRPAVTPPHSAASGGLIMPTRATAAPIRPPRESAQWPKTLAETGAPTGRARRRRGRVGAALGVVAVLAVILTAALVASATGLVTLPGPQTQASTQASPSAPAPSATATATLAPTATVQEITPAANLQQVADQRAYNSFHSATLGHGSDASCASANASTSFSTGQPIYINLCTSASVAANALGVTVRQIGKSVCTLSPVQSNTSYYCHSDYSLDPGRYDIIVTMKVNGTQATARDLPFTVVK